MTEARQILMSTTDQIPERAGSRKVASSEITFVAYRGSVAKAFGALEEWAAENGYDAVIGVRLEAHPHYSYGGDSPSETNLKWTAYGTAIQWAEPDGADAPK